MNDDDDTFTLTLNKTYFAERGIPFPGNENNEHLYKPFLDEDEDDYIITYLFYCGDE